MLDVGWTELLVIGALALIVVGPRDLPQLLRSVGQTVGKIRRMAREFQRSIEDAARDADVTGLKEMRDLKKDMGSFDFRQQAAKAQSYMNQPVNAEASKAGGAASTPAEPASGGQSAAPGVAAGGTAASGTAASGGADSHPAASTPPPATSAGPAEGGTAAPGTGSGEDGTRQAGTGG